MFSHSAPFLRNSGYTQNLSVKQLKTLKNYILECTNFNGFKQISIKAADIAKGLET